MFYINWKPLKGRDHFLCISLFPTYCVIIVDIQHFDMLEIQQIPGDSLTTASI